MRKFLSVLLVSLLLFSFTACGSEKNISQGSSEESMGTSVQESSGKDDFSQEEDISDVQQTSESEDGEKDQAANNILIVYFSRWGNTDYPDDVDVTTSASIVPDGDRRYGTTEYIANLIADEVSGDLYLIETVTPYTADFDELRDVNHDEMEQNYLPELKESDLDIAGYDMVFVGYPIWWYSAPMAVFSFLEENDLSGKKVVLFCSHGTGGLASSVKDISAVLPDSEIETNVLGVYWNDIPECQETINNWLEEIGY